MATYSFFDHGTAPALTTTDASDSPVTLGFLWTSSTAGTITSVWVYVANTNLSGVSGSALIYHGGGFAGPPETLITQTDFTFQGTVGWQEIILSSPVSASANQQFIAAVFFNSNGHYCADDGYYDTERTSGPLFAYEGGVAPGYDVGNGRWASGSSPAYPQNRSNTHQSYLVDVTFTTTGGGGGGSVSVVVNADDTTPNTGSTVNLTATPSGGSNYAYQWSVLFGAGTLGTPTAANTTFTPTSPGKTVLQCAVTATGGNANGYATLDVSDPNTAHTGHFTASATDTLSAQATGNATLQVNRGGLPTRQKRSLYGHRLSFGDFITNTTPIIDTVADNPVTFALRTYLLRNCMLTGIRFLKAPLSAGVYTVVVWQLGNTTPLVTKDVTLAADNGGWVEVTLDVPLALTASNTVPYLIGYFSPDGNYLRAQWVYGSQDTVEYPFHIGLNGGGFGQVEGTGVAYGGSTTYPATWVGHSYFIDPMVEWQSDSTVYTGGYEYFKQFSAYSSINKFPIGVWQAQPSSLAGLAALGINTLVTFFSGSDPSDNEAALVANNMDAFPEMFPGDTASLALYESMPTLNSHIKGYLLKDEPDLVAPWTSPTDLQNWYAEIRARDSTKLLMLNLGKGPVVNKSAAWQPAGATPLQYNDYWRQFAHLTDITSCDFYMEDSNNSSGGVYGLWCNPRMVQRLQDLSDNSKPVWHYISTAATPSRVPTPATVYSSVWASLIGGARGIVFFDFEFDDNGNYITDFSMNTYPQMASMVQALTARIQSLSDALMGPEAALSVNVDSSNQTAGPVGGYYGVPIHYTIRQANGKTYLFTQSIRPGTTTGTFTVPAAANKVITVIDESRTITADGSGVFTDNYTADYQVHLYQWT